jgi:cytochrome c peroxidase
MYRTTPLRGLWARAKGGYYHDGRFPDLMAVVDHYDSCFKLGLSSGQKADLVQFLKSR